MYVCMYVCMHVCMYEYATRWKCTTEIPVVWYVLPFTNGTIGAIRFIYFYDSSVGSAYKHIPLTYISTNNKQTNNKQQTTSKTNIQTNKQTINQSNKQTNKQTNKQANK